MTSERPAPAPPDLAALIGSRICHDLISPVGAIGNGVELLGMSGAPAPPEVALIAESVSNANARIRFFRIAFGHAAEGQVLGRAEIQSILGDLYGAGRLKVHWAPTVDAPRNEVRVAFLLLQCLEAAMPYGGQIHVSRTDGRWRLQGEAAKMKDLSALWPLLEGAPLGAITPSQVQFALVAPAVASLGRRLVLERGETRVAASF